MERRGGRTIHDGGSAAGGRRPLSRARSIPGTDAAPRRDPPPLAGERAILLIIAASLAAGGAAWISLQPAVTHSDLDGNLTGALLRWYLYLPLTIVGVWLSARRLDRRGPRGPGPVETALTFAVPAVVAGTLTEIAARLALGHGDVLALDGVLQRIIELVRVDVPISVVVAIALTHRLAATAPAGALRPDGRQTK